MRKMRPWLGPICALLLASPLAAEAADHFDGPATTEDEQADISDIYAWMSGDATRLILAMNIVSESFAPGVQYVLHVGSTASFPNATPTLDVICEFDAAEAVSCWAGEAAYVTGDARTRAITSDNGRLRVFAGQRRDPFFFNADGFATAITLTQRAAPSLTFDPAGCPILDGPTSTALVTQLARDPFGGPAVNFFAGRRVSSIVIDLDKTLVNTHGDLLAISASTRR